MMNDQSVSLAETMNVPCHSSFSASRTYRVVDGVSEGNRLRIFDVLKKSDPEKLTLGQDADPVCSLSTAPVENVIDELHENR